MVRFEPQVRKNKNLQVKILIKYLTLTLNPNKNGEIVIFLEFDTLNQLRIFEILRIDCKNNES
jgi:hypothetical protein